MRISFFEAFQLLGSEIQKFTFVFLSHYVAGKKEREACIAMRCSPSRGPLVRQRDAEPCLLEVVYHGTPAKKSEYGCRELMLGGPPTTPGNVREHRDDSIAHDIHPSHLL